MARGRGVAKRAFVPVAVFAASFLTAAVVSARLLQSRVLSAEQRTAAPWADPGKSLTTLPSALDIRRLVALSDPTAVTRWAPVLRATRAHTRPDLKSPVVGLLRARTSDGTTNIVVADAESEVAGQEWVRVGLAKLPNDTKGWVPRRALGGWSFVDTRLVIDRGRFTATLLRAGRIIFRAPIGVGAPGTPTPAGQFYVRDRLSGFSSPVYGPLAFGTNAKSPTFTDWPGGGVVGIHGTNQPWLIPGRVSHGCIRLRNAAIVRLGQLMPVGTTVTIE